MLILPSGHNAFTLAQRRVLRKRTQERSTHIKSARQILLVFQMAKLQKVKITVLKRFSPSEVFPESPVTPVGPMEACELLRDRQEFIVENLQMPKGFCTSAWVSIYGNVRLLAFGGNLPWFKETGVAINCCSDGLRPVIFKLERA